MDKKFEQYLREYHSEILSHTPEEFVKYEWMYKSILAITYKYLGDNEKSRELFKYLASVHIFKSRFDVKGFKDEMKNAVSLLISIGDSLVKEGIYLNLANMDKNLANQHFIWAAENCLLSDEELFANSRNFDLLALANLWRGYSLLVLGKYDEACPLINSVDPLFNKWKKGGGEMEFMKTEYFLPKLLTPLCEYKLNPSDENRKKAVDGVERFLDSFKDESDKLDAYIYCLHLKELYPEVYSEIGPVVKKVSGKRLTKTVKSGKQSVIPEEDEAGSGTVAVIDRETNYERFFGDARDVERYLGRVKALGDFPALVSMCELYMMDEELDPEPIMDDCIRLLNTPGVDDYLKGKTGLILDVAREASEKGSTILFFYYEDLEFIGAEG